MNKHLLAFYALVAAGIAGLIFFVQNYPISFLDIYITHEIQKIKIGNFTFAMTFISVFGNAIVTALLVIFTSLLFFATYHRREAYFTLITIIPDLFNILVKILIHRPRPTLENAKVLLTFTQTGFPSGHVVHYVVFFGFLLAVMVVNKKIPLLWRILVGILSASLILAVSISRIFLGAHWATDVLGGYLFGIIYLGIILKFYLNRRGSLNAV